MEEVSPTWSKVEAESQVFAADCERTRLVRSAWMAFYTVKGRWEISLPGVEHRFEEGDVAWIPSGMMADQRYLERTVTLTVRIRAGAWVPHAEGDRDAVAFRERLDQVVRRMGPHLPLEANTTTQLRPVFRQLIQTWRRPESLLHRGALKGGVLRLFQLLAEDQRLEEELLTPYEPDPNKEAREKVAAALQLLNNRDYLTSDSGSVESLAKVCGYRSSRFHSLFVQATGMTPNRYLTERRVALACQLLGDPNLSILDVAFGSGFGTQSRFYLAFRQVTGMTPAEWRRKQKPVL